LIGDAFMTKNKGSERNDNLGWKRLWTKKNRITSPLEEDKMRVYIKLLKANVWIHKTNIAIELAIEENSKKVEKMDKELVPKEYHEYLDIFNKEKAH
jgi:hypothetical protein